METKLLIISKGSTFMVEAIEKNLKEVGFDTIRCEPAIRDFKDKLNDADILLIYLGDYIEESSEAFIYLKDICSDQEKSINVIGDSSEMEDFKRIIPESMIENIFSRPLDVKKLVEVMEDMASSNTSNAKRKSILLVDDDPTFLKMVKGWLSEKYNVTIVSSGMQAITFLAKNTPDLILLDYEMPITDGPQIFEMIRSENTTANIPVVFLTGKGDKESVERVLALKPQGYILKTASKYKLLNQIKAFFEGQGANQY